MTDNHDVTALIVALRNGDPGALDALFGALYDELRRVAHRQLAGQDGAHTLSATAVVHEVYLKLQGPGVAALQDRAHFLTLAARAMRQVLVDYARARLSKKRGGGARRTVLDEAEIRVDADAETIVALDSALDRLQATDERLARVVSLRYFGGLSSDEAAEILGVTERTVRRDWRKARAYLYADLYGDDTA